MFSPRAKVSRVFFVKTALNDVSQLPNRDPQYSRQSIVSRADGRAIAVNGANILAARLQVLGAEGQDSAWTRGGQQASSRFGVRVSTMR